jgi:hypothetical protein
VLQAPQTPFNTPLWRVARADYRLLCDRFL